MRTLLRNGNLIDGLGHHRRSADIAIEDGRIAAIDASGALGAPHDELIELDGRTVMPGLIDCHVHITLGETLLDPRSWVGFGALMTEQEAGFLKVTPKAARDVAAASYVGRKTLEAGFTTVRDLGTAAEFSDIVVREAIANGFMVGPRVLASGGGIAMTGGHGWHLGVVEVDGPDAVRAEVRRQLKAGADVIKIFASRAGLSRDEPGGPEFSLDEMRIICDEAHQRGKRVAAHAVGAAAIRRAVLAGVDSIEHGCLLDEETAGLMAERGTWLVSTLHPYDRQARFAVEYGYPPYAARRSAEIMAVYPDNLRRAMAAGVRIALGSDCGIPKLTPHGENARELVLFADMVGVDALTVIGLATRTNAEVLGLGDEIGTVVPGKRADLAVLDADPLADLSVLLDPTSFALVLKDGRIVVRHGKAVL